MEKRPWGYATGAEMGAEGFLCGPFVYIEQGLGMRGDGASLWFFVLDVLLWHGQHGAANAALGTMAYAWNVPLLPGGILFTALLGLVIVGGIRRIGTVAER